MAVSTLNWHPQSWRDKPAAQQPDYRDQDALQSVVDELSSLPPLVTSWEIESLKKELAEAAQGKRFLLQGGDCSESFVDCRSEIIANKLKVLLQMSVLLIHGGNMPVTRVGRIAGQYAKPRSNNTETIADQTLPTYRGDMINRTGFTESDRDPDPQLLLRGYERAALTLNFVRALTSGGFADLHQPDQWDLDFVGHSPNAKAYSDVVASISESIRFLETVSGLKLDELTQTDFYSSHECLHLHYEQAQTRTVPRREGHYDLSTHFPWIGNRTRNLDGAHIEFVRGIQNPIGIKVGPGMKADDLLSLIDTINPDNEPGKITLIHRMGRAVIEDELPGLIWAVSASGRDVLWCCDPMHGNTELTADGIKTRRFENIMEEVDKAFDIHDAESSILGGVHVELTGENVTECTGGARGLDDEGLKADYRSQVDPRLNYEQSIELALLIGRRLNRGAR